MFQIEHCLRAHRINLPAEVIQPLPVLLKSVHGHANSAGTLPPLEEIVINRVRATSNTLGCRGRVRAPPFP